MLIRLLVESYIKHILKIVKYASSNDFLRDGKNCNSINHLRILDPVDNTLVSYKTPIKGQ